MANVVFIFHDFWGCKRGNEYIYPAFHHGLIEELRSNGNNVYCYVKPITARAYDFSGKIKEELLNELKELKPDLFIIINNRFWDISDYFDCPIICYSVDSPSLLSNLELLKKKKDRFKFVAQQSIEVELIESIIGANKKNIEYILSTTPIQNTNQAKDKNISFLGSQWLWEGLPDLVDYMKKNPTREDSIVAKEIHKRLINIEAKTYNEIIEELYNEHPEYPAPKLKVRDQDIYVCRMSGIRRARYLAKLADLGLEIYGNGWGTACMAYFPELALNWISTRVITAAETESLFNSSKICFQLNHIQAKTGFSWKIPDIMASGGCLVTNSTPDFKKLFGNNIPTFESEAEARELCEKLLNNPNMREDIVLYSNQKVEEMFRPRRAIEQLENLSSVKLIKSNTTRGEFKIQMYKLEECAKPTSNIIVNLKKEITSFNQFPNVSIKNLSWNKKFYYLISRYFFKCFEKKRRINMKVGDKFCIRFFGFNLIELKKRSEGAFDSYVMGVPLFAMKAINFNYSISLLAYNKVRALYMKKKEQKRIKNARKAIIDKFKDGKKLNICIQVCRPGLWNLDYLYKILDESPYFNPSILIMPDKAYKREMHELYARQTYDELIQRGYKPFKGYDFDKEKIIDIRKEINPDIILFTDFWKPHFFDTFYINRFRDKITFLNEYGFSVMQDELTCNFELNNLVDLYFRPTQVHVEMAQKLMNNKGINVLAVGHPKIDALLDKNVNFNDVWKTQDKPKKRIIWAPHYNANTSKTMYQNDAFYVLYDFMLDIAEKYKEDVQFVFRPHPVLYQALEKKWGLEDVKKYYQKWDELDNGQYYAGNFVDLFATSDAMIMDSCSFMAEYTAFNKPLFHTVTQTSRTNLNEFGEILYKNFYTPINELESDIENFIQDVVINGNDYKKEERTEFVKQYFGKINGKTASENIYDEIIKFLEKGEV